jgi:hypothetical protein
VSNVTFMTKSKWTHWTLRRCPGDDGRDNHYAKGVPAPAAKIGSRRGLLPCFSRPLRMLPGLLPELSHPGDANGRTSGFSLSPTLVVPDIVPYQVHPRFSIPG